MPVPSISRLGGVVLLVMVCLLPAFVARAHAPSSELIDRAKRVVVILTTYDAQDRPLLQGSAFFTDTNHIVTSLHLLRGASRARIQTIDGQTYPVEGIADVNEGRDLVLLETFSPSFIITPLAIAEAVPQEGERVFVVSNPEGSLWKVTRGKILASWDFQGTGELLSITARLSPGSSGSPVINRQGKVVGIATMHMSSGDELNFAVPAMLIKMLRPGQLKPLPYVSQ